MVTNDEKQLRAQVRAGLIAAIVVIDEDLARAYSRWYDEDGNPDPDGDFNEDGEDRSRVERTVDDMVDAFLSEADPIMGCP
jgi:hypothetical protein